MKKGERENELDDMLKREYKIVKLWNFYFERRKKKSVLGLQQLGLSMIGSRGIFG